MFSEHTRPDNYAPSVVAHERLVIDLTAEALACVKRAKRKGKNSAATWPETTILALANGGWRRIHTLPPGLHVPREEIEPGVVVYGCAAREALAGTAPLRGKEAHKSKRPLVHAPQHCLDRLAVPIAPTLTKAIDPTASRGDTIPPDRAEDTAARDAKSASGHASGADDGNRAQRSPDGASEASGTVGSVPFMITTAMKRQLRELGYTDDQIRDMRPAEAHAAIAVGKAVDPEIGRDEAPIEPNDGRAAEPTEAVAPSTSDTNLKPADRAASLDATQGTTMNLNSLDLDADVEELCGSPAPIDAPDNVVHLRARQSGGTKPTAKLTRFELFAHNGFTPLLLPAGHLGWAVAPESTVEPGEVAKVPMYLGADGLARGYSGWTSRAPATEKDIERWQRMGCPDRPANVSLRTGQVNGAPVAYGATDIDVECPVLAPKIIALARECLGMSPRRIRQNSPRALMLYRLARDAADLSKLRLEFTDGNGVVHAVETLLRGQQCIVAGLHKSGTEYEWPDGYPVAGDLPEIGKSDIGQFLQNLKVLLLREGCVPLIKGHLGRAEPRNKHAGKRIVAEDETAERLARDWMERQPAAEYGTIDDTQYKMAARCGDFGCGVDTVEELLTEWCMKHDIPTSPERLRTIASSALRNRENAIGARHPEASGFEAVEITGTPPTPEQLKKALGYKPANDDAPAENVSKGATAPQDDDGPIPYQELLKRTVPPVQELVPGLIQKGIVTLLCGPGATHKSRIAQQFGLSIDAGLAIFGRPVQQARFIYLSCEDEIDEVTRRAQTITRRLQLPNETDAKCWDRRGKDAVLAVVKESGECAIQPFWKRLHAYLCSITGHKFVVLDGTYNVLRFEGHAKVNETSVMAAIGLLQRLCDETDATILSLWHPSQAGLERGDNSGWSVAWHNAPRARLSLTKDGKEGIFDLKVEKRSHGKEGEIIKLHWNDGVLLPRGESLIVEDKEKIQEAAVAVAIKAAETKRPIQSQRRLENWQMEKIERLFGHRVLESEAKDSLATALSKGKLQYIHGNKYLAAGYYPPDSDRATELAREAKRADRATKPARRGAKQGGKGVGGSA